MADLIDLAYLKTALGVPAGPHAHDARWTQAIAQASQAIRTYTERSFDVVAVTANRVYDYDGSGYLDIDDATSVTGVTLVGVAGASDYPIPADSWRAMPPRRGDSVVFYYLSLPLYTGPYMQSPEMGFTRNLDVLAREGRLNDFEPSFRVNATWGWPEVPDDVKRATVWTAAMMGDNPKGYTSESIEGYSRTISLPGTDSALPQRAVDLLTPYIKIRA